MNDEALEYFEYPEAMFGGAEVFVLEDEDDGDPIRVLYVGGGFQSATFIDERRFDLVFEYYRAFDCMFDRPSASPVESVLMIGSGGCSYVKHLIAHHDDVSVDAVEIDPVVLDIARKHFYVDELIESKGAQDRLALIAADGRAFLEGCGKRYDAVLNDSFSGTQLVAALASTEAAQQVKCVLNPGGIYLANVVSADEGRDISRVQDVATTLKQVFEHVEVLPCFDEDYAGEDNYLIAASDAPLGFGHALKSEEIFQGRVICDEK